MLTTNQVGQYTEEGYVVVPGIVDTQTLKQMKAVLSTLVEDSRTVSAHTDVYDLEPGHSSNDPRVRRIKKPHLVNSVFLDFARSPLLTQCLMSLIGTSGRLNTSKLNLKAPGFGSPVEWHQDWAFYPHTNDDILAVGVMLDDTTTENGAMLVLPGSHRGQTFDHHDEEGNFCGAMNPDTCGVDFSKAVPCEGPAGSASFHHVRLVHGSAQNTSKNPRGLLLYEVCAGDAFPLMGINNYADFKNRLLFGEDTVVPRSNAAPVRMPLPAAKNQGSIYENQTSGKRFFGFTDNAVTTTQ
jgi:phytanoyl-CoA hydroxylase